MAEVLLGIGQSCISGTDTALLYDTLLVLKEEDNYIKVEGRMTSVGNFSEAIAGIAGGFLASISPRIPFICQAVIALIAIPAALTLTEPTFQGSSKKPSFSDLINTFKEVLIKNRLIFRNIMLSSVIGASTLTMAWFVQPFFKEHYLPTVLYGILWTLLNGSVGIAALLAYKFEKRLGEVKTVVLIVISTTIAYVSLAIFHTFWGILFIFIFYLIRGIATPVLKDYINKLISSETRASVLSLRNLVIRGIFSTLGPIWGYLTDHISLGTALFMAGTAYFICSLPFLLMYTTFSKE